MGSGTDVLRSYASRISCYPVIGNETRVMLRKNDDLLALAEAQRHEGDFGGVAVKRATIYILVDP